MGDSKLKIRKMKNEKSEHPDLDVMCCPSQGRSTDAIWIRGGVVVGGDAAMAVEARTQRCVVLCLVCAFLHSASAPTCISLTPSTEIPVPLPSVAWLDATLTLLVEVRATGLGALVNHAPVAPDGSAPGPELFTHGLHGGEHSGGIESVCFQIDLSSVDAGVRVGDPNVLRLELGADDAGVGRDCEAEATVQVWFRCLVGFLGWGGLSLLGRCCLAGMI